MNSIHDSSRLRCGSFLADVAGAWRAARPARISARPARLAMRSYGAGHLSRSQVQRRHVDGAQRRRPRGGGSLAADRYRPATSSGLAGARLVVPARATCARASSANASFDPAGGPRPGTAERPASSVPSALASPDFSSASSSCRRWTTRPSTMASTRSRLSSMVAPCPRTRRVSRRWRSLAISTSGRPSIAWRPEPHGRHSPASGDGSRTSVARPSSSVRVVMPAASAPAALDRERHRPAVAPSLARMPRSSRQPPAWAVSK